MTFFLRDLQQALLSLLRRPGYWLACVLTLGLGLGANVAIFSLLNAVLLNPIPSPNLDRVVSVWTSTHLRPNDGGMSVLEFSERRQAESLEALALSHRVGMNLQLGDRSQRLEVRRTTASLFQVLGVQPALGRAWSQSDEDAGRDRQIVLSHTLWQSRFQGDPAVLGRVLRFDGEDWTVIGVMPEGFYYPSPTVAAYAPFHFAAQELSEDLRGRVYAVSIGLLKHGRSAADLEAELQRDLMQRAADLPDLKTRIEQDGHSVRALTLTEATFRNIGPVMLIGQGAVLMVLLVAIANLSGLTVSQWLSQQRALAVRCALGASRWQVLRRVLAETLILALSGSLAAVALSQLALAGLFEALGPVAQRMPVTQFGAAEGAFTVACAAFAAVLAMLAPALASLRLASTARLSTNRNQAPGAHRLRAVLVAGQAAFAVLLLSAAILLMRSMQQVMEADPGYATREALTVQIDIPEAAAADSEAVTARRDAVLQSLRSDPRFASVGAIDFLPYGNMDRSSSYQIEGREPGEANSHAHVRSADADFFAAMQVPLRQGRWFDSRDQASSEAVAIVDAAFVAREFPNGGALGARINGLGEESITIIGVVPSLRLLARDQPMRQPVVFRPLSQAGTGEFGLILRPGDAHSMEHLTAAVRQAVAAVSPDISVFDELTLDERIGISLAARRGMNLTLGALSLLAIVMTALGLFGALALVVSERRGEFGIRLALGARAQGLRRLMFTRGLRISAFGGALGLLGALALSPLLRSELIEVDVTQPLPYVLAALTLLLSATLASLIPALRAGRVAPMTVLRGD